MKPYRIGPAIKHVNMEIEKRINVQNAKFDLTLSQGMIVIYLADKKDHTATQSELMDLLHVAHTTTLTMLKSMEKKHMITIRKNPADRRSNLVTLTWGDESAYRQLDANAEDNENTLLLGFSKEEADQFAAYLERALQNLQEHPAKEA